MVRQTLTWKLATITCALAGINGQLSWLTVPARKKVRDVIVRENNGTDCATKALPRDSKVTVDQFVPRRTGSRSIHYRHGRWLVHQVNSCLDIHISADYHFGIPSTLLASGRHPEKNQKKPWGGAEVENGQRRRNDVED